MPFAASLMTGLGFEVVVPEAEEVFILLLLLLVLLLSAPPPAMKRAEWISGLPTLPTLAAEEDGANAEDDDKIARVRMV